MILSLNEVEALARKAARGAGLPWGVAEEAGMATRWLCAHGVDGAAALAAVLRGDRAGPSGLDAGIKLADRAMTVLQQPHRIADVTCPALVLPFAAAVARRGGGNVSVAIGPVTAVTDGTDLSLSGDIPDYADIAVMPGGELGPLCPRVGRAAPSDDVRNYLEDWARRTYAPATEESRRMGAGAGLTDND